MWAEGLEDRLLGAVRRETAAASVVASDRLGGRRSRIFATICSESRTRCRQATQTELPLGPVWPHVQSVDSLIGEHWILHVGQSSMGRSTEWH